jgi:hypothetical protein
MNKIMSDPFWDGKTGGGVRCSVEGEAANQYQDPSTQFFEGNGGRSIASLLPSGVRGVVIPRATTLGGSRGFDPHKPRLINIDPDIKGQSCVVDLSKITKESMEEAFLNAAQNPLTSSDIRLLASQTFHNLAVGYEPVGMGPANGPRSIDRRAPLGDFGYVVPQASLGGGQIEDTVVQEQPSTPQENISPSVTPRTGPMIDPGILKRAAAQGQKFRMQEDPRNMAPNAGLPVAEPEPEQEYDEPEYVPQQPPVQAPRQGFVDQSPPTQRTMKPARSVKISGPPIMERPQQAKMTASAPETQVTFEIDGWGSFEAMYHEVIKNDCVLVLVFDNRFKGGGKYFPPSTDKLMAVKVANKDTVYFVHSYGTKFQHDNFEYCMLVIEQDQVMEG